VADCHARAQYVPRSTQDSDVLALVREHWPAFRDRLEERAGSVPAFVRDELEALLTCGGFEHGFLQMSMGKTRARSVIHERRWGAPERNWDSSRLVIAGSPRGRPHRQRAGKREHPPSPGHGGQVTLHQQGGGLGHPPTQTRRVDAAALAGKRNPEAVAAALALPDDAWWDEGHALWKMGRANADANLLEFAVGVGDGLSVKAELAFPIEAEIEATEPYMQILRNPGNRCGTCHDREQHWETVDEVPVFASEALQYPPEADVSPAFVGALAQSCDVTASPERCAMLTAVFAHGDVVPQRLPEWIRICRLFE